MLVEANGQEAEQTLVTLVGDLEVIDNATLGAELDEVYEVGNEELCEDCLKDMFRRN